MLYLYFIPLFTFRLREEVSPFLSKISRYMLDLLQRAVSIIEEYDSDIRHNCFSSNSSFDNIDSILAAFRSFTGSPLFRNWRDQNVVDVELYTSISESLERLLKAMAEMYAGFSDCSNNLQSEIDLPDTSKFSAKDSFQLNSSKSKIVDMELDVDDDAKDIDSLTTGGKNQSGISTSAANLKLDIISIISNFFSVVPFVAWDILFNLMKKESDPRVCYNCLK